MKAAIKTHRVELPGRTFKDRPVYVELVILGQPNAIFYAGFGNEGQAVRHIARLLQAQKVTDIALVSAMPYWCVSAEIEAMCQLGKDATIAVAEYIARLSKSRQLDVIAESQAAAAVVDAALVRPDIFNGRIALLRPMGLVRLRKRQFVRRMVRGALQLDQLLDWRTLSVARRVARRTIQDLCSKSKQLNEALVLDVSQLVQRLHDTKGGALRIFTAERDALYPPPAIRATLSSLEHAPEMEIIAGTHSSPATKAGTAQIRHTLEWCRNGNY